MRFILLFPGILEIILLRHGHGHVCVVDALANHVTPAEAPQLQSQSQLQPIKTGEENIQNEKDPYVTIKIPDGNGPYKITLSEFKTIRNVNAYLAIMDFGGTKSKSTSSVSLSSIENFRIIVENPSCSLRKTSSFSKQASCDYSLNGGSFGSYISGGCIGLTISNGTIIHPYGTYTSQGYNHDDGNITFREEQKKIKEGTIDMKVDVNAAFGITYDDEWIIGDVLGYNRGNYSNIKELVTGLNGWLVRNSTVIPEEGDQGGHLAPRSAIGIKADGKLVLLQVDGCEHCLSPSGLSMYEMATLMSKYVEYGINLDGGGSSTSVGSDGRVINHPTCLDYVSLRCERPVASAVCIGHSQLKTTDVDVLVV